MKTSLMLVVALIAGCGVKTVAEKSSLDSYSEKVPGFDPSTCSFASADPFEPRSRLAKGPNAGLCIDSRKSRSVVRLTEEQAKSFGGNAKGYLSLANVTHKGKFHVAHIPLDGIRHAIFQLEYFPAIVPAGHTQLRLQFNESTPVTLISQEQGVGNTQVDRVTDLVLSVEALAQPGFKYDLKKGMEDHFAAVYRITSLEEKFDHMVTKQKHRVEQWRLNVEPNEARKILEKYAEKSQSLGTNEMYHTLTRNCTTEIVEAIDEGMTYNLFEKFGRFTAKTTDFYPNVIRISLQKRGLLPRLGKANDIEELDKDPSVRR